MYGGKEVLKAYPFRLGKFELSVIDDVPDEKARRWYFTGGKKATRAEKLRYIIRCYKESQSRQDGNT